MSDTNNNQLNKGFGGNVIAKFLFGFHWILFVFAILLFILGLWKIGIAIVIIAISISIISYRLAGGKRNPFIWKDKNLYDLLKHAALTGKAKIGFHSLRDQNGLLNKLKSIGIEKKENDDVRSFIRNTIVKNGEAFNVLRDNIIIQTIHDGKEWFWDGYGNQKPVDFFHEAEIIFNLNSSANYMFVDVLQGLKK